MSNWANVALRDVADVFNGKTPSKSEQRSEGHPVLKIRDVSELGRFRGKHESFVDASIAAKYSKKLVRDGDTLILNAAHNADYVGSKTYRAEPSVFGTLATGEWLVIRPLGDKLDASFVHHWITSKSTRAAIRNVVNGIHLYPKDVARLEIPLPPISEQRRIAALLDQVNAVRAKRREALTQLDSLTRSIFDEMFGDPVTNPKGWPRKLAGEIGSVVTGNTPSRANPENYGDGIEWIKSDNINTPHYYLTVAKENLSPIGKSISRTVPSDAILVTCIAGSPDCIGNAAMTNREVAFNQQINAFLPKTGNPHFYYAQIIVGKKLIQEASTGGMKGMVSKGRFERIGFIVPPCDLQHEFARLSIRINNHIVAQRTSLAELDELFASIQLRAFRGEL